MAVYSRETSLETRTPVLLDAISAIHLAALVTPSAGGMKVTHLPLAVRHGDAGKATLVGHFARANDHWKLLEQAQVPSVAIFQGPHAYISPANYATKQETGKVVPTWAYVIVHAHGVVRTNHDPGWMLELVNDLTDQHEAGEATPWKVSDAPDDYVSTMLRGIVGLEMEISQLEGVWKLNQHRSEADKALTAERLSRSGSERDRELAAAMADALSRSS